MKLACVLVLTAAVLSAQSPKPETVQAYDCYVQSAEARMAASSRFLTADSDTAAQDQLVRARKILTVPGNGPNPHKVPGGMIYDWIGTVFVPGVPLDRAIRMLQDYDHRIAYMPAVLSEAKLLCRTGEERFGFTMTLKEPAPIEVANDVTWERLDPQRWRYRSYSTKVHEIGKQHNYLFRLNSYWRFYGTPEGVYMQSQTITLSGEFSGLMRTLGSLAGLNPETSVRKTLDQVRESLLHAPREFSLPPGGMPDCGPAPKAPACAAR